MKSIACMPVKEEYETQIKIPKPILIEIFQLCGLENFLKISQTSKQFYFLIKSDNFWLKMLKTTEINEIELDSMRKSQSLVEIYKDTLMGWDLEASHLLLLDFNGKDAIHKQGSGIAAALTKKKFILGEENYLFTFEFNCETGLSACGISKVGRFEKKIIMFFFLSFFLFSPNSRPSGWLHDGDLGWGL